jgi:hypothetical protein
MIYLCSPYSHPDPFVREDRYLRTMQAVVHLMKQKEVVFSPIVHCHEIAKIADLPKDVDFWWEYNKGMIDVCTKVFYLRIEGWTQSKGLIREIDYAYEIGKKVFPL